MCEKGICVWQTRPLVGKGIERVDDSRRVNCILRRKERVLLRRGLCVTYWELVYVAVGFDVERKFVV